MTGQETTSNQLSFTLYEILRHPDVENRYESVITASVDTMYKCTSKSHVNLMYA